MSEKVPKLGNMSFHLKIKMKIPMKSHNDRIQTGEVSCNGIELKLPWPNYIFGHIITRMSMDFFLYPNERIGLTS